MENDQKQNGQENNEAYLEELRAEYERIFETLKPDRQKAVHDVFTELKPRLLEALELGELQEAILQLKLARHFQRVESEDANVLFDALVETPKFLESDRGSLTRLLEVHEQKTLQKIAETRRQQAESTGQAELNPFQKLVTTHSGKYYIARLLNMPHLAEESAYMRHCVGTSTSYLNRMKRGEIEILSFRDATTNLPVMTIEYNLNTKQIDQIKKFNDGYLRNDDPYFHEFMEALELLRQTRTDAGKLRDFRSVYPGELPDLHVQDYHILTSRGEVSVRDFNPASDGFILRMGNMLITPDLPLEDACKIIALRTKWECRPEELALSPEQINAHTKVYAGPPFGGMFNRGLERIFTPACYPLFRFDMEVGGKTISELQTILQEKNIGVVDHAWDELVRTNPSKEPRQVSLTVMTVEELGFTEPPVIEEIYNRAMSLGLKLPPFELPFYQFVQGNAELNAEWIQIARKEQAQDGDGFVYYIERHGNDFLETYYSSVGITWSLWVVFVFQVE